MVALEDLDVDAVVAAVLKKYIDLMDDTCREVHIYPGGSRDHVAGCDRVLE